MGANFLFGRAILDNFKNEKYIKLVLFLGVTLNLFLLGYYKYSNFFVDNINSLTGSSLYLNTIVLPLGISFFTFEQIAYLVDTYRGKSKRYSLLHYCTFVTFFPQLIAGPIAHHKEIIPQLENQDIYKFNYQNFSSGITLFFIGLFKKVMIADKLAGFATPVFDAAELGYTLTFFESWIGALAYTFQIYFDFSGYSDMAIGLGIMLGIKLPFNFNSPYKATNIIEFWRRWHMTLSRFLRDYLYIPLGGNRKGTISRYNNLIVTMLLGGLWHGASWTFVVWGGLHGFYLIINHSWSHLVKYLTKNKNGTTHLGRIFSTLITFIAVIVAWVFFRAESFQGAMIVLEGMVGSNGIILPDHYELKLGSLANHISAIGVSFGNVNYFISKMDILFLSSLFLIVWALPNSQEIIFHSQTNKVRYLKWKSNFGEVPEW